MKLRGSLRTKLSLTFVATLTLVAIMLAVVMPSVIYLNMQPQIEAMQRIVAEQADRTNRTHLAVFEYLLQTRLAEITLGVELAFGSGIQGEWVEQIAQHRVDLEAWLKRKQEQLGLSLLTVVAPDGRTLARATRPGPPQDRVLFDGSGPHAEAVTDVRRLVQRALRRNQSVTGVEILAPAILVEEWVPLPDIPPVPTAPVTLANVAQIPFSRPDGARQVEARGLTLLTVQPVKNRVGQIVGGVVGGQLLNHDPSLLQQYRHIVPSGGASIYLDTLCIASNLDRLGLPSTLGGLLPDTVAEQLPHLQAPTTDRLGIGPVPLAVAYLPLRNSNRKTVGALLASSPASRFDNIITEIQKLGELLQRRSWRIMLAEVGLCGLLAVLLTYILANRMLTPLAKLRDGAKIIGAGDFDHRLDIRTGDELQELAQDFNEMAVKLAEARRQDRLALVGRMAGTIIHDLRNPLTAIRGYAPLLEEDTLTSEQRREFVKVITASSSRITDMVQDLLDFARGQERALQIEPVALSDFLHDLESLLRRDFEQSPVELALTVRQEAVVAMDQHKMQRVLINLASNAREAMEEKGQLRIEAGVEEGQGVLRVIDNGPGIPEEIRDRLFQPFVTQGKRYGTGLGLTICQQFVEAHGGVLEVETATGQGTTFTIRLPLAEEEE